jgi:gluconolactonase
MLPQLLVAAAVSLALAQPQPPAKPADKPVPPAGEPKAPAGDKPAEAPGTLTLKNDDYFVGSAEVICEGFGFTEGPLWLASHNKLIFSDIGTSTIFAWAPGDKEAKPFREKSERANGNCLDKAGNLITCESNGRVTRATLMADGVKDIKTIADKDGDKRLNSPNDVVTYAKDGSIYFTDPSFFVDPKERQLKYCGIYRIAADGKLTLLNKDLKMPNGLAFSADGKKLYVGDTQTNLIHEFPVKDDGTLGAGKVLAELNKLGLPKARGAADGLKLDEKGNIYTTGPGGIVVLSPEGKLLAHLPVRSASNLCFGGPDGKTLFVTAGAKVWSAKVKNKGL